MPKRERRNRSERTVLLQSIVNSVVRQSPSVTMTVETLQAWVNLPSDVAERILLRLADSGLVREVKQGVFVRGASHGAAPAWQ